MGLIYSTYSTQQSQFITDVFNILWSKKATAYWGQAKGTPNITDGVENPQWGIREPIKDSDDFEFYDAANLMNKWFLQNITVYRLNKFVRGEGNVLIPREATDPAVIRTMPGWVWQDDRDIMNTTSRGDKNQFDYIYNLMTWLFSEDAEMGARVRGLVLPVDSTTE